MKIVAATIHALRLPFVEAFAHSAKDRSHSDSVIVRVVDETGIEGWGEGVPRPYVTGETAETMLHRLGSALLPAVLERELPTMTAPDDLGSIDALIPEDRPDCLLPANAARAALEVALLDAALRRAGRSMRTLLPPVRQSVVYGGVITAGSPDKAVEHARQMKLIGLRHVKVKVGIGDDVARVRAIREVLGPGATLRVDANGAWTATEAIERLSQLVSSNIAAVEQPLPRGGAKELAAFRRLCPVPVMVDESLVTLDDADALIAAGAVDFFNVRVSKCGGLGRSAAIARRALAAGVGVQIGCQVGETAILSAAGRHLAASLERLAFTEGSFGTLLLSEDVSVDNVRFGHRGRAPILGGQGLGIRVAGEKVRRFSIETVTVGREAQATRESA